MRSIPDISGVGGCGRGAGLVRRSVGGYGRSAGGVWVGERGVRGEYGRVREGCAGTQYVHVFTARYVELNKFSI